MQGAGEWSGTRLLQALKTLAMTFQQLPATVLRQRMVMLLLTVVEVPLSNSSLVGSCRRRRLAIGRD